MACCTARKGRRQGQEAIEHKRQGSTSPTEHKCRCNMPPVPRDGHVLCVCPDVVVTRSSIGCCIFPASLSLHRSRNENKTTRARGVAICQLAAACFSTPCVLCLITRCSLGSAFAYAVLSCAPRISHCTLRSRSPSKLASAACRLAITGCFAVPTRAVFAFPRCVLSVPEWVPIQYSGGTRDQQ